MRIVDALLAELDREAVATRRLLEREVLGAFDDQAMGAPS